MKNYTQSNSPRGGGEVGEIDTRAPFQSVKAAVSLFGEAFSKERHSVRRRSSENVLEKETQLLLAQKDLNKLKKQLESAETTKAKALSKLENAKVILQDLTTKLTNVKECKQSAIEAAEAVKNQAKQLETPVSQKAIGFEAWKQELEHAREEYMTTVTQLDASKQELTKIRQDFDAVLEAKLAAFQTAGEAQRSAKLNSERASELSKEIAAIKESIEQLKLASVEAQEEQAEVKGQKETQLGFYKHAKEEAQMKLLSLKNEYEPELTQSLDAKLNETSAEIEALQEQMKKVHAAEMNSVRLITSELKEATKALQDVAEEESFLKNLVFSIRTELNRVKKEQDVLKEKQKVTGALVENLTGELEDSKGEARPEPGSVEEKEADIFHEQSLKIQKLSSEKEEARREAEEMSRKARELKQEAEKSRAAAEEAEKKLELVLKQAEEAKAAEKKAIEEMKFLAKMQGRVSNSEFSGKIILSIEEYESLRGKVKECEELVEKKEAAAMAEAVAINRRKYEVDRKVEANLKAVEEIKVTTELALWSAEMADSAKVAVEGELRRCRQQEQKVVGHASSQILDSSRPIPLPN